MASAKYLPSNNSFCPHIRKTVLSDSNGSPSVPRISQGRELPSAANKSCSLFFGRAASAPTKSLLPSSHPTTDGRTGTPQAKFVRGTRCMHGTHGRTEKSHFAGNKMMSQGKGTSARGRRPPISQNCSPPHFTAQNFPAAKACGQ